MVAVLVIAVAEMVLSGPRMGVLQMVVVEMIEAEVALAVMKRCRGTFRW